MQMDGGMGARDVTFPEWRLNVVEALRALCDSELHERHWRRGEGWPDLDAAVHWLIDDTWMDQRPPRTMIPALFRSEREADIVQTAVDALLAVVDDLGDVPDTAYLDHPGWLRVFDTAEAAVTALEDPAG
jgi:hypothetical protein